MRFSKLKMSHCTSTRCPLTVAIPHDSRRLTNCDHGLRQAPRWRNPPRASFRQSWLLMKAWRASNWVGSLSEICSALRGTNTRSLSRNPSALTSPLTTQVYGKPDCTTHVRPTPKPYGRRASPENEKRCRRSNADGRRLRSSSVPSMGVKRKLEIACELLNEIRSCAVVYV